MWRRLVFVFVLTAAAVVAADNRAVNPLKGSGATNAAASNGKAAPLLVEGEINGAKYAIALPAKWNHRLLLLAHGLRAETIPLVADLFVEHGAYKALLAEGWIVAKTSYRRNGIIIDDAIADLDALRSFIAEKYGQPDRVLLEGESMGGLIVTLMAERNRDSTPTGKALYTGAVAIGAALNVKEVNPIAGLTNQPRIPLIFLTNQSEMDGPEAYVSTPASTDGQSIHPVLFRVSRNGHVNVNQSERLIALRALNAWIDGGPGRLPKPAPTDIFYDATQPPTPGPSQVTLLAEAHSFTTRVNEVSGVYGNVQLNAQAADFEAAGIKMLNWFQLKVGDKTYRVRYGRDFTDVKRGEWVAFPNADGYTWLARNYANAATSADLKLGDTVTVRGFENATEK
jgi:hypothetical protein